MPTLRIWVKKSVQGPHGPIEIGLGGTHEVTCEPYQVSRERLALYQNYKEEVDRLIDCELHGKPVTPPVTEHPRPASHAATSAQPPPDSQPVDLERSRQVLAELQERLAQKGRARDLAAGHITSSGSDKESS